MNENVALMVVLPCLFTAGSFIVWSVSTNIRRARVARAMVDMQTRMLEKMPPEELPAYANSEAGRAILSLDAGRPGSPRDRILNAITAGLIIGPLGMALFSAQSMQSAEELRSTLQMMGAAGMAVGAGLLISAAISYKLSQAWGLFEEKK